MQSSSGKQHPNCPDHDEHDRDDVNDLLDPSIDRDELEQIQCSADDDERDEKLDHASLWQTQRASIVVVNDQPQSPDSTQTRAAEQSSSLQSFDHAKNADLITETERIADHVIAWRLPFALDRIADIAKHLNLAEAETAGGEKGSVFHWRSHNKPLRTSK